MTAPAFADVAVGAELPQTAYPLTREALVRYAGASGDFNVIHWNERAAKAAGLPDVIAHGMLTMAQVARLVTDWTGDPGAVTEYRLRFSRPVAVPDEGGARIVVRGRVEEKLDGNRVAVALEASVDGAPVVAAARAVVRLG
ncbi:MaoC/PaaZ C-terminal domain-containing protein [Phytohabitans sp. ZYX-F-186]|uniref:MaoC/PaaZ C-terminal domain-containing protein n=1 Tax=Phytohabitans maris TaxID=3071409 RepID=A0ABU0Z9J2_9ACTN|nr:MaoC/PaaZ C-terminal domain-containing protein [Phytohabitans sp. ZYX-F-186]MDQ7903720.1 MaoC/PaaZ C-terminal domain-containing protein [Phytohabitans sp. ZYX-F-186]